ncbi:outer membrane beta-barrel protein [Devosia aquimaris]|uniref:outer membrane beta-barrel protein n=1 Tax=Devosia aquimaris TaxID=2866214 RepID=UPI001CD0AAED|nr:outer membrane beta-barrel protein [Devosia sp. CJK-A8-3]
MGALCLAAPALAGPLTPQGAVEPLQDARLSPGIYPTNPALAQDAPLREPYDPFFDIDWSVSLRGSYTKATESERFDVLVSPSVTLKHTGVRSAISIDASAELVRPKEGQVDVTSLRLGLNTGYVLDSQTRLTANGSLSVTRALAGTPGVASTIAVAPQTITGSGELGVTRTFGMFNVGVTGALGRSVYGQTTLTSGANQDNSEQNFWSSDAKLRIGYQATPIFEVFGAAGVGRDMFDLASSSLGVRADATTTTLEGGVTGRWNTTLEATASTGLAMVRYDAAGLGEVNTQLYNASVSYTPDPTLRLRLGLATTVAPPGPSAGGTTRIGYGVTGDVSYALNSRLALRASADWNTATFAGSTRTEKGYGWGLGADYTLNTHTAVTADYDYDQSESSVDGTKDAHRVKVGVTLKR